MRSILVTGNLDSFYNVNLYLHYRLIQLINYKLILNFSKTAIGYRHFTDTQCMVMISTNDIYSIS